MKHVICGCGHSGGRQHSGKIMDAISKCIAIAIYASKIVNLESKL